MYVTWVFRGPITKVLLIIVSKKKLVTHYHHCIFILYKNYVHPYSKILTLSIAFLIQLLNNLQLVTVEY